MGAVLLRLILLPLRAVRLLALALALCLAALIGGFLAKLRDDQDLADEASTPEGVEALAEFDEDDDALRRWLADLGAEDRAQAVASAFGRQQFQPSTPFIPYWLHPKFRRRW